MHFSTLLCRHVHTENVLLYSCVCFQMFNLVARLSGGSRLAVEKMYISLIHSGDLLGGSLSSGLLLNPKITLHSCLHCHSE